MWLFWVIGKEVRKYTESPGFAPRVEMPFSRTTAKRVPAGTLMGCDGPAFGAAACTDRGAGGGADVCGPSGSCDRATPEVVPLINNAADRRTSVRLRCMAFSVLSAMPARELRMLATVYAPPVAEKDTENYGRFFRSGATRVVVWGNRYSGEWRSCRNSGASQGV